MAYKMQRGRQVLPPLRLPQPPSYETEGLPTGIYVAAGPSAPPLPPELDSPDSLDDKHDYDDVDFITTMDLQTEQCYSMEERKKYTEMQNGHSSAPAAQGKDRGRRHIFILYGLLVICLLMLVVFIFLFLVKYSTISEELKELHINQTEMTMTMLKGLDNIQAKQEIIESSLRSDISELRGITASLCTHLGITSQSCPKNWKARQNACYFFSTEMKTWSDSLTHCAKQSAHLVTVETDEEQGFLIERIHALGTYWLGTTDLAQDGKWRWSEGDKPVTISFWDFEEPKKGYNKDCGIMYPNGSWAASVCSVQHHWICEKHLIC